MWRLYRKHIQLIHKINSNPALVDDTCLIEHVHDDVELEVAVLLRKWTDFKLIRQTIDSVMESNNMEGNIGTGDMETYIVKLQRLLSETFDVPLENIRIKIWETSKYGVSI